MVQWVPTILVDQAVLCVPWIPSCLCHPYFQGVPEDQEDLSCQFCREVQQFLEVQLLPALLCLQWVQEDQVCQQGPDINMSNPDNYKSTKNVT